MLRARAISVPKIDMAQTRMKHKKFYGAFNSIYLLALNAKPSVVSSLAPNLQISFVRDIFLQKNGATQD
jgi:hypothetical protein